MSNNEFGCLLIVIVVVAAAIIFGVAAGIQQGGLETRIEALEKP